MGNISDDFAGRIAVLTAAAQRIRFARATLFDTADADMPSVDFGEAALERTVRLDMLINNAGVSVCGGVSI